MKKIYISIIFALIIGLMVGFLGYEPVMKHWNKFLYDRNKKISNEVKIMSTERYNSLNIEQYKLAQRLENSIRYPLIGEEVRKGASGLYDVYYLFLSDHPEIEKIKIKMQVINYKLNSDETINFFTDGGEILEVYTKGKWEKFNSDEYSKELDDN